MKMIHEIKKCIYSEFLVRKLCKYDSSYHFFVIPQGLGDILFVLMYLTEYRKKNPQQKIAIIVEKKHLLSLVKLFSSEIDLILKVKLSLCAKKVLSRFHFLYPEIYNSNFPQPNLLAACRKSLGLISNAKKYIPNVEISNIQKNNLDQLIFQKTALIATDAVSCSKIISDSEWETLARNLSEKGYLVYFNTSDENRFKEFKHIFLDIEETIYFCNKIQLFVGYRSGLCDVVAAFCNCKQFIYYPNNRKKDEFDCIKDWNDNPNLAYLRYDSLKTMFPEKDITEVIYRKSDFIADIEESLNG